MQIIPKRHIRIHEIIQRYSQIEVKAPGRANLIGEHTDYNGGQVLPFTLEYGLTFQCAQVRTADVPETSDSKHLLSRPTTYFLFSTSSSGDAFLVDSESLTKVDPEKPDLSKSIAQFWGRYALGALRLSLTNQQLAELPKNMVYVFKVDSNLPRGAGLSSSAAFCTGLITSISASLPNLKVGSAKETSLNAMLIEHRFSQTMCGLMDQLAVSHGRRNTLLHIDFLNFKENQNYKIKKVKVHEKFRKYKIILSNTNVPHSLGDSPYNQRREACEKALALLQQIAPKARSLGYFSADNHLEKALGSPIEKMTQIDLRQRLLVLFKEAEPLKALEYSRRAAHAIYENIRVRKAVEALERGEPRKLRSAMKESHWSLDVDYEVTCPELNILCEAAERVADKLSFMITGGEPAILGPRMTGAGFGGSTIQFVHTDIADEFCHQLCSLKGEYYTRTQIEPTVLQSSISEGLRVQLV